MSNPYLNLILPSLFKICNRSTSDFATRRTASGSHLNLPINVPGTSISSTNTTPTTTYHFLLRLGTATAYPDFDNADSTAASTRIAILSSLRDPETIARSAPPSPPIGSPPRPSWYHQDPSDLVPKDNHVHFSSRYSPALRTKTLKHADLAHLCGSIYSPRFVAPCYRADL
jgi:hypothetical protein